ncbi:MAG: 6-bladed beta-propeller [Sulfurimicrobium sp.]|nr:6-bladed beta-propeller [Sulfurimicrobium sp.]
MLACLGVVLTGLFGCASEPPKKKDYSGLIWPLPPEQPRVQFVAEYHGQRDLGVRDELKAALLGEEPGGLALKKPYGVTASPDGKLIYVTDTGLRAIVVFDLEKKAVRTLQTDAQGVMYNPLEIRLDSKGLIFVSDSERKEVLVMSQEGKTLMALGKKEEIGRPTGLALDEARNRLYVADTTKHRIVVYDLAGNYLHAFGERGAEPGQLNYPVNLALDRDGQLLVTDSGNFRVQVFDGEGKFLNTFGQLGDSYGAFSRPKGIALDSDNNVYVVDAAFNNFQIFNREGKILLFVGSMGREPGMFWLPAGIFVDASNRIYVVDAFNSRVQIFQYLVEKGAPIGK